MLSDAFDKERLDGECVAARYSVEIEKISACMCELKLGAILFAILRDFKAFYFFCGAETPASIS